MNEQKKVHQQNELLKAQVEKARLEAEKARLEAEKAKLEAEKLKKEDEKLREEIEKNLQEAKTQTPHSPTELEQKSIKFRSYKILYIVSYSIVELVILFLTFIFLGPPPASPLAIIYFDPWIEWDWLIILVGGNLVIYLFFTLIRKFYFYITIGKKFW